MRDQPRIRPGVPQAGRGAGRRFDLSSLRSLTVAGSPLPVDGSSGSTSRSTRACSSINGSGGTDMCTGIVQGCPLLPVYAGEIAGRCLGVDAAAFDEEGEEVVGSWASS